ncbi:MAG: septum formation inhibitor Maf [Gammaproteobacteria bacterium]|nr:septum formation inhibitor Maf [Gammaproteobacteria bacterium]
MTISLLLASSSPYRRELLARLGLPFLTASPEVDEAPQAGERATALVERLARLKAQTLASRFPDSLIIGSDQAATVGGASVGKPATRAAAVAQLQAASGQLAVFQTGVCVLDARSGRVASAVVPTLVHFRQLSTALIERYLAQESALDCAGSFKSESLGIALCQRISSEDPTALVGLPLIALVSLLHEFGVAVPG